MYPYNHRRGQRIQTNTDGVAVDRGFLAHFQVAAASATVADTDGVHAAVACTTPAVAASAVVKAASSEDDKLTIAAPAALGAAPNALSVSLVTAEDDTLAVTGDDETGVITIALANATASKNAAAAVQAAIRALEDVAGIDVSEFTCTAAGNWDTAAVATGEEEAIAFDGGQTAAPDVITTGITQPSVPRNITATVGGTATDIAAVQVTIEGTNYANEPISEKLDAFTANTAGTVTGDKAFKTVTKITIPAHDGTGATTAIGFGEKLGLPFELAHNTVLAVYKDNVLEAEAPTVTTSATNIEDNTIDLNSALNSKVVDVYLIV
jgi:hypothetical protein